MHVKKYIGRKRDFKELFGALRGQCVAMQMDFVSWSGASLSDFCVYLL
jgi:hypothetical protein